MKKGTIIKMKAGKFKLYCKDKEYLVFAKLTIHKDESTSMNFDKTVTFSALPEHKVYVNQYLVK